jgi:DNA-binding transcriptional ArsR family regulator
MDEPIETAVALRGLVEIDRLLHEPARLVIAAILYAVESADFLYLLRETGLTKGNLSSHLSKLEEAGYVVIEKTYQGKKPRTICRMTGQGKSAFDAYRDRLRSAADCLPD